MRIHFSNTTRPKLVARALRKALTARGRPAKIMECQEITANLFGYPSWSDLIKLHANRAPSLDDAEAPSQRNLRRQEYLLVLQKRGIDPEMCGGILDEIKPTDRTPAPPNELPRLLAEAFETDDDGKRLRSLGLQDLTWSALSLMAPHTWSKVCPFPEQPTVYSLSSGLSEAARTCGMDGRLALPGLRALVDAFVATVGGETALHLYRRRLDDYSQATWSLEEARKEELAVRHAQFSMDFASYRMFHSDHGSPEYSESIEDLFDGWGWDTFQELHKRPGFDDQEASKAWDEAYASWVADNAPPFAFATKPDPWGGVDAQTIREWAEESERSPDVSDIAHSSLEEHYEDACDDIIDLDGLYRIVDDWFPHAGKKDKTDLELEAKVESWNAKQTIVSYYPDSQTILPAFDGKTKEDAIAWCRANVEKRRQRLRELGTWIPPVVEAPAEPTPGPVV